MHPGYENDRYRIDSFLASGGMADVFVGWDKRLDRQVAIKVPKVRSDDPVHHHEVFVRFQDEAQKMATMRNSHVLEVYSIEIEDERPWMVMAYAEGGNLEQALAEAPYPPEQVARILGDLLEGLREIHEKNLIHRDIKPANILKMSDGRFVIGDFGIARTGTEVSVSYATLKYRSPETADGRGSVPASDLYALGLVAYELLLGSHRVLPKARERVRAEYERRGDGIPTVVDAPDSTFWAQWPYQAPDLPPPHELDPKIPASLSRIVHRMTRKSLEERYASAAEVLADLSAWKSGEPVGKSPPLDPSEKTLRVPDRSPPPPTHPNSESGEKLDRKRRRLLPLAAAALLLLLSAGAAAYFWQARNAEAKAVLTAKTAGLEALAGGDSQAASDHLDPLVDAGSNDVDVLLGAIQAHYELRNYGRAERLLESARSVAPGHPRVPFLAGLVALARSDLPAAIEELGRAVELAPPEDPEPHFYLGYAYWKNGDRANARGQFRHFLDRVAPSSELAKIARRFLAAEQSSGTGETSGSAFDDSVSLTGFRRPDRAWSSYEGRPVLLHLWASWCEPCRDEMPSLVGFFERDYPDLRSRGLRLVTVSNDYTRPDLARFVDARLTTSRDRFPVYWDPNYELNQALGIDTALPRTLLIDRAGAVAASWVGAKDWQDRRVLREVEAVL